MKEYSANNRAADQVIGISHEEARDIRYALSRLEDDETLDLDVDIEEAREVLGV